MKDKEEVYVKSFDTIFEEYCLSNNDCWKAACEDDYEDCKTVIGMAEEKVGYGQQ